MLGRGATSVVLSASHQVTNECVAIKLAKDAAASPSLVREQRFLEQLARDSQPGLIRLLNHGSVGGRHWLALECLADGSLRDGLRRWHGPITDALDRRVSIAQKLADGLAVAHARGIVHGDLTPENILFRGELPVITDWATARLCPRASDLADDRGDALGTPGYIAPERLRGERFDSRADMYSLGCILYELWTGRAPFVSDDTSALCRSHLTLDVAVPSRYAPELPPALEELVLQLLAKNPRQRLSYASQVAERLARYQGHSCGARLLDVSLPMFRPSSVERDELMSELVGRMRQAATDVFSVSLIRGEPGGGHTRLLEDLDAHAQRAGYKTVWITPGATQVAEPLASLRHLLSAIEDAVERTPASTADSISLHALLGYSQRLRCALPMPEELPSLPFEQTRERLQQALWAGLEYLARMSNVVLLVDALETVDELTASFLETLDSRVGTALASCVFIASTGSERSLKAWSHAVRFELEPLSEHGVRELLTELFAGAVRPGDAARLAFRVSGGSPARIVELAARFYHYSALRFDSMTCEIGVDLASVERGLSVPRKPSIALDARGAQIAAVIAAAGMCVETELIDAVLETLSPDLRPIELTVDQLRVAGVLTVTPYTYRFSHESLRHGCLAAVESHILQRAHAALASALMRQRYGRRPYRQAGLHWIEAGDHWRAVTPLSIAGRRAARRLALKESIDSLTLALELTTSSSGQTPWSARAVRLALRLLESLSTAARHDEVLRLGELVLTRAPERLALPRARAAQLVAQSERICGRYAEAEAALTAAEQATSLAGAGAAQRASRAWIETQLLGTFLSYARRDLPGMHSRLSALTAPVRRWGSREQQASYYMWRANAIALANRYTFDPVAVRLERRALQLLRQAKSESHAAGMCQFDLAFMLLLGNRDNCSEAYELLVDAEQRAKRLGDAVLLSRILTYQAIALRRTHKLDSCAELAGRAFATASRCKLRGYMGASKGCLAWVALKRDDLLQTRTLCAEADALFTTAASEPSREYPFRWLSLLPQLAADTAADRMDSARDVVAKLCSASQARLAEPLDGHLAELSARWLDLDDATLARRLSAIIRCATQLGYL